jgi:hypothetical protein
VSESSNIFSPQYRRLSAAFDSAYGRTLVKVLSLCGIPDKYDKVISAIYENEIATVKVGNDLSS